MKSSSLSFILLLAAGWAKATGLHTTIPLPYGKHHVLVTNTHQSITIDEKTSHVTHYTTITPYHKKPYKKVKYVDVVVTDYVVRYDHLGPHAIPGYPGYKFVKDKKTQTVEVDKCIGDKCVKYEEIRVYEPVKTYYEHNVKHTKFDKVYTKDGWYTITYWPDTCHTTYVHKPTVIEYKETTITCKSAGKYTATLTPKHCKTTHIKCDGHGHKTTAHCHATKTYTYTHHSTPSCKTHTQPHPTTYTKPCTTSKHSTKHTTTTKHTTKKSSTTKHHTSTSKHTAKPTSRSTTTTTTHSTSHSSTSTSHSSTSSSTSHSTTSTTTHTSTSTTSTPNPSDDPGNEPHDKRGYSYYEARAAEEAPEPAAAQLSYRNPNDRSVRNGGVLRSKRSTEAEEQIKKEMAAAAWRRDFSIKKKALL